MILGLFAGCLSNAECFHCSELHVLDEIMPVTLLRNVNVLGASKVELSTRTIKA